MSKIRPAIKTAMCAAAVCMAGAAQAADYGGAGIPGASPCYAVFHELPDGRGVSMERQGPESVKKIRRLHYSDGRNLNSRVMSVTTGPGAVLTLYKAGHFLFEMMQIGPDSRVNLPRPTVDSYHLRCTQAPPPAAYAPPPGYK